MRTFLFLSLYLDSSLNQLPNENEELIGLPSPGGMRERERLLAMSQERKGTLLVHGLSNINLV
jgi:hypothetical protein